MAFRLIFSTALTTLSVLLSAPIAEAVPTYRYTFREVGIGASIPGVFAMKTRSDAWYEGLGRGEDSPIGYACLVYRPVGFAANNWTPANYYTVSRYQVIGTAYSDGEEFQSLNAAQVLTGSGEVQPFPIRSLESVPLSGLRDERGFILDEPIRYGELKTLALKCVEGGITAVSDALSR